MVSRVIDQLVQYGIRTGLTEQEDEIYSRNQLLDLLKQDHFEKATGVLENLALDEILSVLLDYAVNHGLIGNTLTERDLFDARLMNCLMPRPSEIIKRFWTFYRDNPSIATDYFYEFSQNSDYIRRYRIAKDMKWTIDTKYGALDITINLSKPEKDPKAIAAAKQVKQTGYPKCLLCMENEGFAGNWNHPARNNHRIIPIEINHSKWGFQYSPYVYYQEHCIVFNGQHIPMKVERDTFIKLFDFVKLFPHYFLGSNADLPIVGGSILTHDHFQGGRYTFAMAKAEIEEYYLIPEFNDIEAGIVDWPMSVLRLRGKVPETLIDAAEQVLECWRGYSDQEAFIFAETEGVPHNTITPIARKTGEVFELDLVLRNNITTDEYPDGVYHPHPELHHIKKENIGLIEVMGLAVLPARLKQELSDLAAAMLNHQDIYEDSQLQKHARWADQIRARYPELSEQNIVGVLQQEVGKVFELVLEDAGVFKCTGRGRRFFHRFLTTAGFQRGTAKHL